MTRIERVLLIDSETSFCPKQKQREVGRWPFVCELCQTVSGKFYGSFCSGGGGLLVFGWTTA